jgi:hypothetical protein
MGKKAPFSVFVSSTYRDLKESQRGYTNLAIKKNSEVLKLCCLSKERFEVKN